MPIESIACKTLLPYETDAILHAKFRIGVVFQHLSNDPNTFIDAQANAKAHALRVLELAAANGQPKDSAIYFGVDGADLHLEEAAITYKRRNGRAYSAQEIAQMNRDQRSAAYIYNNFVKYRNTAFKPDEKITAASLYPFLKIYFETIAEIFSEHAKVNPDQSYKIGIYCTSAVCTYATSKKLAEFFWVTAEGRDDPSYADFIDHNPWHLLQQRSTSCPKWSSPDNNEVEFDFNRRSEGDIGDWNSVGKRTPIARPKKCPKD